MKLFKICLISFCSVFFFSSINFSFANLDDSIFIIKSVSPSNGQNNISIDLHESGSYSNPPGIGVIDFQYGTDTSGNCGNPPNCPNQPEINSNSINSSTIVITNNSSEKIYAQYAGSNNYHFSIRPYSSSSTAGVRLQPNTTYTVTIKGGVNGINAKRTINRDTTKVVYLPQDYIFSFTTNNITENLPTLIPQNTYTKPTPTIYRRPTYQPQPTPTLIPTISSQMISPTKSVNKVVPTSVPTLTETKEKEYQNIEQEKTITEPTANLSFFEKIKLFFNYLINKKIKRNSVSNIEIELTPTTIIQEIEPTQIATPSVTIKPTSKPTQKPKVSSIVASTVDENILKTKFGINDSNEIKEILNNSGKLERYERELYNTMKTWPEIKGSFTEQRIYLPTPNTVKICKTLNISEIKNAQINILNMYSQRQSLAKSGFGSNPTSGSKTVEELNKEIQEIEKSFNSAKDNLNSLISKYCR